MADKDTEETWRTFHGSYHYGRVRFEVDASPTSQASPSRLPLTTSPGLAAWLRSSV